MSRDRSGVSVPAIRVQLAADPASVPGARRFVTDGLSEWGRDALVDDAALCVTELAANSALHSGSPFMDVVVHDLTGAVRVAVEDEGQYVPVDAVVPQNGRRLTPEDNGVLPLAEQSTTGRGLSIVAMLAASWGIDETSGGRRIWADVTDDAENPVSPPIVTHSETPPVRTEGLPTGWQIMRMPQCPVALGVRIDQHLDEVVRELQLIDASQPDPSSRELAALIEGFVTRPAYARHTGRRIGQEAAARGLEYVDIEIPAARELSAGIRGLAAALDLADRLCEERELLTVASTPAMRSLREWFTESMVSQLEEDAEPISYADWLARDA